MFKGAQPDLLPQMANQILLRAGEALLERPSSSTPSEGGRCHGRAERTQDAGILADEGNSSGELYLCKPRQA